MSTGHVVVPEIISRLVGQMIDGLNGSLLRVKSPLGSDITVDLKKVTGALKSGYGTVLLVPSDQIEIEEDYYQFIEFWAMWKRARQ